MCPKTGSSYYFDCFCSAKKMSLQPVFVVKCSISFIVFLPCCIYLKQSEKERNGLLWQAWTRSDPIRPDRITLTNSIWLLCWKEPSILHGGGGVFFELFHSSPVRFGWSGQDRRRRGKRKGMKGRKGVHE